MQQDGRLTLVQSSFVELLSCRMVDGVSYRCLWHFVLTTVGAIGIVVAIVVVVVLILYSIEYVTAMHKICSMEALTFCTLALLCTVISVNLFYFKLTVTVLAIYGATSKVHIILILFLFDCYDACIHHNIPKITISALLINVM